MHMADALVSPPVGGALWAVSGGLLGWCARHVKRSAREDLVPLMGVLGAFVFAAQMINFSIPGTGSSGHLGGGLILAALLGPQAALLVIASVLTVQALFFADGGLLALGCNILNLGFFPAFVAYPLVYRPLAGNRHAGKRAWAAAVTAAVVGLQLGAFGVVLETTASGIADLPFGVFVLLMQPIHLAIGVIEGLVSAAVIAFVARARPATFDAAPSIGARHTALYGLLAAAILAGGIASWFASTRPDGLEWAIARVTGGEEVQHPGDALHRRLARAQERTSILPDYGFKTRATDPADAASAHAPTPDAPPRRPAPDAGTSASGLLGGLVTLGVVCLAGAALRRGTGRSRTPRELW